MNLRLSLRILLTVSALSLAAACSAPPAPESPSSGRSNSQTARDFEALFFQLESGRELPFFTRFEGPVRVALRGQIPPTAGPDLNHLLLRLRREAQIDISRTRGSAAEITVEFRSRAELRPAAPEAACFVVPNVSSWEEFLSTRGQGLQSWSRSAQRERIAVFIPSDIPPQDIRDCLHEEIAQGLGPLNDLWHLSDSIFNDDNFLNVLTSFDMLVLKLAYRPELKSGMSRAQTMATLREILPRIHPEGGMASQSAPLATSASWDRAMKIALTPEESAENRATAARRATWIAARAGWTDNRRGFSHYIAARQGLAFDIPRAVEDFAAARSFYSALPEAELHKALVDLQMAAFFLAGDAPEATLLLAEQATPVLKSHGNHAAEALALLLRAESYERMGRHARAAALRLDSLAPARYGFKEDTRIRAGIAEIGR